MGRKRKDIPADENPGNGVVSKEGSGSSTIFQALFGSVRGRNSGDSLFSENNPFRRKKEEAKKQGPKEEFRSGTDGGNSGSSGIEPSQKLDAKRGRSDDDGTVELEKRKKLKAVGSEKIAVEKEDGGHRVNGDIISESNAEAGDKRKKKRKREDLETVYEAKHYGVASEAKEDAEKSSLLGSKRKNIDNPEDMVVSKEGFDDEDKLMRTIFVGNLPLKAKKKELLKEFGKFGEIESVRIRSVPIVDGKMPRKGAVIKKRINENGDSVHAYIVFKTEESAKESLTHNMSLFGENHIRVDRACPPRKKIKGDSSNLYDKKRTVFVGNLPFDVKDEEVYKLFSGLKNLETSIEAVRVVRDPGSSLGKGIAYVLFKTTDAANLVVRRRNLKIRDRELRLSHAKSTDASRESASFTTPEKNNVDKSKPNASSYQGLRANKSGSQKKRNPKSSSDRRSSSDHSKKKKRSSKRPAVAARKAKALQAAGSKRKLSDRTPETVNKQQLKKTRKFR